MSTEDKIYRFVKASGRTPDLAMSVNLLIDGRPAFGKFFEHGNEGIALGFEASNGFGTLYNYQFEMVEWLEEIDPTSKDKEIEVLKTVLDNLLKWSAHFPQAMNDELNQALVVLGKKDKSLVQTCNTCGIFVFTADGQFCMNGHPVII